MSAINKADLSGYKYLDDDQKTLIAGAIERLEPTERMAVKLKYCEGLTWRKVAYRMGYSESQARRYGRRGRERLVGGGDHGEKATVRQATGSD